MFKKKIGNTLVQIFCVADSPWDEECIVAFNRSASSGREMLFFLDLTFKGVREAADEAGEQINKLYTKEEIACVAERLLLFMALRRAVK